MLYRLLTYNYPPQYNQVLIRAINEHWYYLAFCLILLPLNLSLETLKWQAITHKTEQLSFSKALKSVLAGFSTGFISPNRLADFVGRALYLSPVKRPAVLVLSVINGVSQNVVIAFSALIAFVFAGGKFALNMHYTVYFVCAVLLLFVAIYSLLPRVAAVVKHKYLQAFFQGIALLNGADLLKIASLSLLRYAVFCVQFYAILRFFGIGIAPVQAFWAIPFYYFFVSFTPSFAFAEATVRSSYALLILAQFAPHDAPLLAFSGFGIWLINFIAPMLLFFVFSFFRNAKKHHLSV